MAYIYEDESRLKYFKSIIDAVGYHSFQMKQSASDLMSFLKPYEGTSAVAYKSVSIDGLWVVYRLTDKEKAERFQRFISDIKQSIITKINNMQEDIKVLDVALEEIEVI